MKEKPSFYLSIIIDIVRFLEASGKISNKGFIKPTLEEQRSIAEYISDTLIQHGISTSEALTGKIELIMKLLFE